MNMQSIAQRMLQSVRGGHTHGRVSTLIADSIIRNIPLWAYDIIECSDEKTGRRFGNAKCRLGYAVKLGSGGRNKGQVGYQIWAVVKPEWRR